MEVNEVLEKLSYFDDKNFVFDEPSHTYRYNGELYFGTTSFLERFVKQFDSDYWSKKKADDEGITQEEMLKRWDAKRDRSCDLGHTTHSYIENFYEYGKTDYTDDEEANKRIDKFHLIYESRLKTLTPIKSEQRVFSKKWKLAGTIDQLYIMDNMVIMGDWKTNQKIKTDKDFAFEYLLPPFNKFKANEINKYSLQLSIYQLILEEAGIFIDYAFICHLPEKGDPKIYKMKDFKPQLRAYLDKELVNVQINEKEVLELTKLSKLW